MKLLNDILLDVSPLEIRGDRNLQVTSLAFDSRKAKPGSLFIAIDGLGANGHDFIDMAIGQGAVAIICETMPENKRPGITYVQVANSAAALGAAASNFHGRPSTKLKLVGITGTNGKTTTATLLFRLFRELGYPTGLISTIENRILDKVLPTKLTTPDALQLNELIARMASAGCTHCFMEASSHALAQHRTAGLHFSGGVFMNISHDHLDYHKTFDEYIRAKKRLFDGLPTGAFSLVNIDDPRGRVMLQNTKSNKNTYGLRSMADFKGKILHNTLQGLEMDIDGIDAWFRPVGEFNAYNLLAAYATAILLEEEKEGVLTALSQLDAPRGRFEQVSNNMGVMAIVDYAHTPDALENALKTIGDLRTGQEKVITVVGAGGNRDKAKRPKMARIASNNSSKVILTSDNSRSEDPSDILDDMVGGIPKVSQRHVIKIIDRREAIRAACGLAEAGDIVLVAGKGHENYQEANGARAHFDDREVLNEMLNN